MPLEKYELAALLGKTPKEIRKALVNLSPEEISTLYDLELATESPREKIVVMLMSEENNTPDDEKPKEVELKKGELDKNKEYNMIWHEGVKCILQNNTIYDRVTGKKIKSVK